MPLTLSRLAIRALSVQEWADVGYNCKRIQSSRTICSCAYIIKPGKTVYSEIPLYNSGPNCLIWVFRLVHFNFPHQLHYFLCTMHESLMTATTPPVPCTLFTLSSMQSSRMSTADCKCSLPNPKTLEMFQF